MLARLFVKTRLYIFFSTKKANKKNKQKKPRQFMFNLFRNIQYKLDIYFPKCR